jgi:PhzF family phenazine biosynthesis protein
MQCPITQVDAFAEAAFQGNPAAVCLLPEVVDKDWMQSVAAEMNLSETAFLNQRDDGHYDLRWFTPLTEVALCGHATLASAHTLWNQGHLASDKEVHFRTQSGWLICRLGSKGQISMDFPARTLEACKPADGMLEALGTGSVYIGRDSEDYLVEVDSEACLRSLQPNYTQLSDVNTRGVIVTSAADDISDRFDFYSRFFAPAVGIAEDPVTGSAHCSLAPYWAKKLNKTDMLAYQASPRGGVVGMSVRDARVLLSGNAITVMHGVLTL